MSQHQARSIKTAVTAVLGFLTALWGWFGWLFVTWVVVMGIDCFTGYAAAMRNGEWRSDKAREGLWHKLGAFIVVASAMILDLMTGYILEHIPVIQLPLHYSMFLTALVLVWYILMELGSIIENVGRMGGRVPPFLCRAIEILRASVDGAAEELIPEQKSDLPKN